MAAPSYPLVLDVAERRVVVVGGGPVAARRATPLIEAGADVVVVAPYLCEGLAELVADGRAEWRPREYVTSDLDGAWLAHTATGDPDVDGLVATDADAARVWCVRADDAAASMAWTPAVARVGDVIVAVSGGSDPGRSVRLRNAIQLSLETGNPALILEKLPSHASQSAHSAATSPRSTPGGVERRLPLRRTRAGKGRVALVGGGPGDPGLITTRGRVLLAEADVVIVDRLAPRALLDTLDPEVEVIDVGKTPGHHPVPQDEINRLLVEHARAGRRVVRLKGGDPFVLGRGGEEAAFCQAAGVPVEVVPGVTSAVSVPAAAGIPVTHRGLAKQFTVVSGHDGLDWRSLAAVEGTLVFLMGVSRLADATTQLIAHGKDADTPAAVIEDGYGPRQRLTSGTLGTIADIVAERDVRPPAVIVIGPVAQLGLG